MESGFVGVFDWGMSSYVLVCWGGANVRDGKCRVLALVTSPRSAFFCENF